MRKQKQITMFLKKKSKTIDYIDMFVYHFSFFFPSRKRQPPAASAVVPHGAAALGPRFAAWRCGGGGVQRAELLAAGGETQSIAVTLPTVRGWS